MPWEFVLPAGLVVDAAAGSPLEERFEVSRREGDDGEHVYFCAQVSALRLERFMTDAFLALPEEVHAVLEVRRDAESEEAPDPADPSAAQHDRFAGAPVSRERFLEVWTKHGTALVHDGLVGFGAWDPESPLEVFLDDHKLVHLFAADEEPFAGILRSYGIPEGSTFPTVLDADHDHLPLTELPRQGPCARRAWPRRRKHDVRWFAPRICRALGLRLQR